MERISLESRRRRMGAAAQQFKDIRKYLTERLLLTT